MPTILPHITSRQDYARVYTDAATWLPAVRAICGRHGLDASGLQRQTFGTHVVYRTGARIVKLFCPFWEDDFPAEQASLRHLHGLPAPELVAEGDIESWPYLVLTVVPGAPALDVWDSLDTKQKTGLVAQLGEIMRQIHDHPPVPELATDWNALLAERIAQSDAHHAEAGDPWRAWVRERLTGFSEPPFEPVLLNADLTEDHLLLSEQNGTWRITGLIDFGDATMGHPHYEFIAPLSFYTFGQPALSRTLVEAYGLRLTADLAERLTTYGLLHKYARLVDFLERHPVPDGAGFRRALWGDL